jgi:hypothetical protein
MSAALGVYRDGSGCSAYSPDDGDNGHIGEWAFGDGLPGGEGFHDEEVAMVHIYHQLQSRSHS